MHHFRGLATIGERDHHVIRHDHAEVPMHGLGCMHKISWRAERRQRSSYLAADNSGFANASDDGPATTFGDQPCRLLELGAQVRRERRKRMRLMFDDAPPLGYQIY